MGHHLLDIDFTSKIGYPIDVAGIWRKSNAYEQA